MSQTATYRVASNPVTLEAGELTVLFAGESQTKPGHRVGPKVVDYFLLHHVISGQGILRIGENEEKLGAGDTFLIRPNELVSYVSDEDQPWKYVWTAFAGRTAPQLAESAGFAPGRAVIRSGKHRAPAEHCRSIYETFRARSRSAALKAAGHLHLLLAALQEQGAAESPFPLRPDSRSEELVRRVIGYLSAQYAEPVTIEGMAETLGYNRAYLSRLFKAHTGLSPATFLAKLRADQGRRLLRERPELSVEHVASSAGFQDALYFSKQFRRWYGQSPTEYRALVSRGTGKGR